MIKEISGNILDTKNTIICHQVNCQGVMGSGIAKQLRGKYPQIFDDYMDKISTFGKENCLGRTAMSYDERDNNFIMNMFSQFRYGRDKQHTDYNAMRMCFEFVKEHSDLTNMNISIPYKIGCGLGGGDWNIVYKMIDEVFMDNEVIIYKL